MSITVLFINDLLTSSGGCACSDGAAPSREGCGPGFEAQRRGPAGDTKMRERLTSTRQGCHFRRPLPLTVPTSTKPGWNGLPTGRSISTLSSVSSVFDLVATEP